MRGKSVIYSKTRISVAFSLSTSTDTLTSHDDLDETRGSVWTMDGVSEAWRRKGRKKIFCVDRTGRISMETVQQQNRGGLLLTILRIDYVIIDFRKLIMIIEFFNFRPNLENLGFEDSVPTLWMVDGSFCRSSFYEYAHIYNVIILFFINISFK